MPRPSQRGVAAKQVSSRLRPQKGQAGRVGTRSRPSRSVTAGAAPGLPLLRTSERGTFKRCRWKWYQEFHEHIKPQVDVPPLRFGSLIHGALGAYYKPGIRRGPHPTLTFEKLYDADLERAASETNRYSQPEIDKLWEEHRDLGLDMLNNYIGRYGKDDEWKVLVTEYPFQQIVHHPRDGHTPWFYYVGVLDGVWLNLRSKRKVIVDHKTAKAITLKYLQMDDQATSYWTWGVDNLMAHGLLAPNGSERLDGMLFNFLRKAKKDLRPQDADGMYLNKPTKSHPNGIISLKQPSPYHARIPIYRDWTERENARLRVLDEFLDIEDVRNGKRAHYKNPGQFTCAGCWAFDMCELHEIGQDWEELRSMTTKSWDPYAQHELMEGR